MAIPEIKIQRDSENYAKFIISPLERGYGTTIGNSLRRILLSSLEGAAVTEIRIDGVPHEFTSIPGVREDVLMIILQLKQLRMIIRDEKTAELHLHKEGSGDVTAAQLTCPENVEIINPELYLFNIDNPAGCVDMTLYVEKGRGYVPSTMRRDNVKIGDIPMDANFSPIVKVKWDVTETFFFDRADYDRLEMEIWTDGTMTPETALKESAKLMINHMRYIFGIEEELPKLPEKNNFETYDRKKDDALNVPLETLELPLRVFNPLNRAGFKSVRDVMYLIEHPDEAKKMVKNFGDKGMSELKKKMIEKGYVKPEDPSGGES